MIIVHVTVEVILALKFRGAVITFEQNRTGGVYSEYVPLHVIIVEGPVATSPADILLLLVVFRNVMRAVGKESSTILTSWLRIFGISIIFSHLKHFFIVEYFGVKG